MIFNFTDQLVTDPDEQAPPPGGVVLNGAWSDRPFSEITEFETWSGNTIMVSLDFADRSTWDSVANPTWQQVWRTWVLALPGRNMCFTFSSPSGSASNILQQVSEGMWDQYPTLYAQRLVSWGHGSCYVRPFWEMDVLAFNWNCRVANQSFFGPAFRRVVDLMRAVPGANFKFIFNPTHDYPGGTWLDTVYPGNAHVDLLGCDTYDQHFSAYFTGQTQAQRLTAYTNTVKPFIFGKLNTLRSKAVANNKPTCIPEWNALVRSDGHGGNDNPLFIQDMYNWIHDPVNNVEFHCVYDEAISGSFNSKLSPETGFTVVNVNAAAKYLELFGA